MGLLSVQIGDDHCQIMEGIHLYMFDWRARLSCDRNPIKPIPMKILWGSCSATSDIILIRRILAYFYRTRIKDWLMFDDVTEMDETKVGAQVFKPVGKCD